MFRVECDDSWGLVIYGLCCVKTHSFHSEIVGSYHDRMLNTVKFLNNFGGFLCLYFYMGIWSACVSVHHVHVVSMEARRSIVSFWNWSYRQLSATTWVLGLEPRSSGSKVSALKH